MGTDQITEKIIGAAYTVANTLGSGFLEKVYETALLVELRENGIKAENQVPLKVKYKGVCVGEYYADILVEDEIIVELKSAKATVEVHKAQVLNYLKATDKHLGLLINFGTPRVTVERIVNEYDDRGKR